MAFDFKGGKQAPPPHRTPNSSNDGYSSSLGSLPRPGGNASPSSGFKNAPTVRDDSSRPSVSPPENLPALNDRQRYSSTLQKTPTRVRSNHRQAGSQIPWRIVLPIIAVIALVVLCFVFKDAITSFLSQVLAWVIIILIIIAVFKWLIFPRRRR